MRKRRYVLPIDDLLPKGQNISVVSKSHLRYTAVIKCRLYFDIWKRMANSYKIANCAVI